VAVAVSARPIVIRTNLREHPAFALVSWEQTHGGALAAIGHLLSDTIGQLLISASQTYSDTGPWGSHWRTDRFWSSEKLQVINAGGELHRYEKVGEIAHEPLAWAHLRVCWENRAPSGNCSRCEKCVRTRLLLAECGELDRYSVFEGSVSLSDDVDALPHSNGLKLAYPVLLKSSRLGRRLKRSVRRLITRNQRFEKRQQRLASIRTQLRQASQWLAQSPVWQKIPRRLPRLRPWM